MALRHVTKFVVTLIMNLVTHGGAT